MSRRPRVEVRGRTSNEELRRALRDVSGGISESFTLPPVCYTGAGVLEAEMSGLLPHSWVGVARADEWKEPGDYRVLDVAGTSMPPLRGGRSRESVRNGG